MPVAHQPPAAIIGELVGMRAQQARNLGLDGLRQKRSRAVAQNLGQRIGKSPWLRELENISGDLEKSISLLIETGRHVNASESNREQSGIIRRQFCGIKRQRQFFEVP
jgi:hypothetical protein